MKNNIPLSALRKAKLHQLALKSSLAKWESIQRRIHHSTRMEVERIRTFERGVKELQHAHLRADRLMRHLAEVPKAVFQANEAARRLAMIRFIADPLFNPSNVRKLPSHNPGRPEDNYHGLEPIDD